MYKLSDKIIYTLTVVGEGLNPSGLVSSGGVAPTPGMGIFAMMSALGTMPIVSQSTQINGQH